MIKYIKRKILKKQLKKTFKEYGFEIKKFQVNPFGTIEYAQWLHPFEQPKNITASNVLFYQKLAHKGSFIIDIGAHTGDTTVPMALAVGKEGKVLGLEPNKFVYKILEQNSQLNTQFTNIIPQCFAATDKNGSFTFNYSDASFCNGGFLSQIKHQKHNHNYTLEVEGKNLQEYLLKNHANDLNNLSLIKVDAEGYDKEILKTIPKILTQYQPSLMIECYKRLNKEERLELFDIVHQHGYQLFHIDNFELFDDLKEIKRENMMDKKHFEILAIHKNKSL
ncbi:FkbM family methyltransferase [Tenacibaculum sp. 190524A02b]|uniref:FkbM family methyltransferase n=1 Tax=Tenacibaculum vairaonense TaxID=3137860 RepID=UPI0031FB1B78